MANAFSQPVETDVGSTQAGLGEGGWLPQEGAWVNFRRSTDVGRDCSTQFWDAAGEWEFATLHRSVWAL